MSKFRKVLFTIPLIPKLGYRNVLYVLFYRFCVQSGIIKILLPRGKTIKGPFFKPAQCLNSYPDNWKFRLRHRAEQILKGEFIWFFRHTYSCTSPSIWHKNPFNDRLIPNSNSHWADIVDFDCNVGDIKIIWEQSRFDWLTDLARAYRVFGDEKYLNRLNYLLSNWSMSNPLNAGPNWKCGQETSFRIFKIFSASVILNQERFLSPAVQIFLYQHITRIRPTIYYAIAQRNNHAISEAAGLYVGASILLNQENQEVGKTTLLLKIQKQSRKLLEKLIVELIQPDGTFAQKSTNYHRVVVDSMSVVLHALQTFNLNPFSKTVHDRLNQLGKWQYKVTFGTNGEVPNTGSNDGAMIESSHDKSYKDTRPSTQQFFGLLNQEWVYEKEFDEPLFWRQPQLLKERTEAKIGKKGFQIFDNQFFITTKRKYSLLMLFPDSKFRPGADPLHIDLWVKGKNILIDCGSYSYNAGIKTERFKSIQSHNTICFGGNEPMPKIGRFLNGEWIDTTGLIGPSSVDGQIFISGTYKDYKGNKHERSLHLLDNAFEIKDSIISVAPAWAFFHLGEDELLEVQETKNSVLLKSGKLTFAGGKQIEILTGLHSRFYMQHTNHQVIKVRIDSNILVTRFQLTEGL